jgi:hypothetical protein
MIEDDLEGMPFFTQLLKYNTRDADASGTKLF